MISFHTPYTVSHKMSATWLDIILMLIVAVLNTIMPNRQYNMSTTLKIYLLFKSSKEIDELISAP